MRKRSPNPKPSVKPADDTNLFWSIVTLLGVAILASGYTAWACNFVVSSFQNSNTMVMLITDAGLKSDDARLERNLTQATQTLNFLHQIGLAVVVGSIGVAITLAIRKFRGRG